MFDFDALFENDKKYTPQNHESFQRAQKATPLRQGAFLLFLLMVIVTVALASLEPAPIF